MKNKYNIIRYSIILGGFIGFLIFIGFRINTAIINAKAGGNKKVKDIEFPLEYLDFFNESIRDSIIHLNTSIPLDSSYYPISNIKLNQYYITILKFNSKYQLNESLHINNKKTKKTPLIWYTEMFYGNATFNFSQRLLKKNINTIDLFIQTPFDTIKMTNNVFIGKGKLKTVSLNFSKANKGNAIVIEKELFSNTEFNIILFKKEKFICILFITPSISEKAMSKEELDKMCNLNSTSSAKSKQ